MSKEEKQYVKNINTTGPPGSGLFSPQQENLHDPLTLTDDFERCIQCGYCRSVCRVYDITYNEMDYAGGRNRILKSLANKEIKFDKEGIVDSIFRCMLCGNCREVCPVGIDTVAVFQKFRKDAINQGVLPKKLGILDERVAKLRNPYNEPPETRFNWTKGCGAAERALQRGKELLNSIRSGTPTKKYKVGYFVGCTSAFRNTELAIATSKILEALKIEFVFFPEEICCGSVSYRTGLEDHILDLVQHNTEMIRESGVEDVVFSCSGCFSTLSLEYPRLLKEKLGFNLYHIAEYIPKFVNDHNLKIKYGKRTKEDPVLVTYHDPCHLGRYMSIYDPPRELINMIEGVKLVEMKHIKNMSRCCGAGGGVKTLYGELATTVATNRLGESTNCVEELRKDRLKEAEETNAEWMVSSCVFCKNNLYQAANESKSALSVVDISEILEDCEFY
ncbi:(Fe-S)-binding protein [Promethearchaeum syntrophicum]|uniref:(Fe-S)-binding protein n=1 Tax=Promethearchaeum syntrophicum TaxID=2594042 RepID=A0A5B9D7U1_9ARCH|nr:(Fe-S)-binding protein [Candidatus Prometheoarchaeum syntrophicum]